MPSICGQIASGRDYSCLTDLVRKYYQDVVIINFDHIDFSTVVKTTTTPDCRHRVEFSLKTGKTGYHLFLPETGNSVFGSFDKSSNEVMGSPQYLHKVNFAIAGITEEDKCFLRELDKGNYVVALRAKGTNIIEIYGINNGLSTADYTFDIVANSGASSMILQSMETSPESQIPFIYSSADPVADFDDAFAN